MTDDGITLQIRKHVPKERPTPGQHPMREVTCRGCSIVFQTHQGTRAYCSKSCLRWTQAAKIGICLCGTQRSSDLEWFPTLESRLDNERRRKAFVADHAECRRQALDQEGRDLNCQCGPCLRLRGEDGPAAKAPVSGSPRRPAPSSAYLRLRKELLKQDDLACDICDLPIDRTADPSSDWSLHIDHIVPRRDGGTDDVSNLRPLHQRCNLARNRILVSEERIRAEAEALFDSNG